MARREKTQKAAASDKREKLRRKDYEKELERLQKARGDLEDRRLVLRARRGPDREPDADRREESERREDGGDGSAAARGERPECRAGARGQVTTSRARMPPR